MLAQNKAKVNVELYRGRTVTIAELKRAAGQPGAAH